MSLDVEVELDGRADAGDHVRARLGDDAVPVHLTWLGEGVHRLRAARGPALAPGDPVTLTLEGDGRVLRGRVTALDARADARDRGATPEPLSGAALRLEALLKARGLDPMRVAPADADALRELERRGRAVAVAGLGEHLHADRLDELVDLDEPDPRRLAQVLRCSEARAAALVATARAAGS